LQNIVKNQSRGSSPKNENSVINLKLFQFFCCCCCCCCCGFLHFIYTKEDIWKNLGYQTVDGPHWLQYFFPYCGNQ